jgi:hypothetical protein
MECCANCGEVFEDDVEDFEGYKRVSFCDECVESGEYLEKLVELYKVEHRIPEDETLMVVEGKDGLMTFVREKDIIEWCKRMDMDESEYLRPEYRKGVK